MCEKGSPPLRLKEWLILQVDSGKYPGLQWENEEKTMFRIPWKHAAKQNYSKREDAAIFKAWTMYKGRFREGSVKEDPSVWKTRLRCALNKSPDFQEVMENCEDNGEPYKLYRIVSDVRERERNDEGFKVAPKSPHKEGSSKPTDEGEQKMDVQNTEGPPNTHSLLSTHSSSTKRLGVGSQRSPNKQGPASYSGTCRVTWTNQHINNTKEDISETAEIIPPLSSTSSDFWLHVRLYYQDKLVTEVTTQTAEGCRLVPMSLQCEYSLPVPMEIIPLPSPEDLAGIVSPDVQVVLKKMLLHMDKGIVLWVAPEGVFVKRQCQIRVYWSGPLALYTDRPNKLEREKTCKLLDTESFMQELRMYEMDSGPEPRYKIQLCFGEEFPDCVNPKKLVTAHVEPVFARELLVNAKQIKTFQSH